MRYIGLKLRLIAALLLAPALCPASGIVLFSENFDELTPQLGVASAGGFSALDGTNVDITGSANGWGFLCGAPESGNCVDLDGSGGKPQGILASGMFTLNPGIDYYLSFDLIGSGRFANGAQATSGNGVATSTTVTFGSYSQTFNLASNDDTSGLISNLLITVASPTTTRLLFTSNTPGQTGAVLDNVLIDSFPISSVNTQSATTSEPAGALLLLSGLSVVWFSRLSGTSKPWAKLLRRM